MAPIVTVEEVSGGAPLRRFVELPQALHGHDRCFAPLVLAWERYRVDRRRHPHFDHGDAALFLARRQGRPAGRIAAHVAAPGAEGRFGFWWCDDDPAVAAALIGAASGWLREGGATAMVGPLSWSEDEEVGVQVTGHDQPGLTGRPWHPPHLARLLTQEGLSAVADHPTWRLTTLAEGPDRPLGRELPGHAGTYLDRRIVLEGVAGVPDVAGARRGAGLRSAWALATRARLGAWDTCTVVQWRDDPANAVGALRAAAGRAGYRWVVAPWTPDPSLEPESVHRTFELRW